jgi:hypothetical protein
MKKSVVSLVAFGAIVLGTVSASAKTTINFLATGSSAMFNTFALAGYGSDLCGGNIWTFKNGGQGIDNRGAGVPAQTGEIWIEWDNPTAPTVVCAYLGLDATSAVELFLAQPASTLSITQAANTLGQNLICSLADANGGLPPAVLNALEGQQFNGAVTEIRPEDALFAYNRAVAVGNATNYDGLGYGPGPLGVAIAGFFGGAATPIDFAISGKDPISELAIKNWTTLSVGADPIVILVNSTQGTTGGHFGNTAAFANVNRFDLTMAVNGTYAWTRDLSPASAVPEVPLNVILDDPLSGTMNTFEFDIPRSVEIGSTQELGNVCAGGLPCTNALNLINTYSGGWRRRAIGTRSMVQQVANGQNGDVLGYALWSTGNFCSEQGNLRYLMVDDADPINTNYVNGTLPGNCPLGGCPNLVSLANVANGGYPIWAMIRLLTVTPAPASLAAMVAMVDSNAAGPYPDLVPFENNGEEIGVFRSHFHRPGLKTGTQISNGHIPGVKEAGGDEGGAVLNLQGDLDNITDTGLELVELKQ